MSEQEIGKLVASIELDTKQMQKDIKDVSANLSTLTGSFNNTSSKIDKAIREMSQSISSSLSSSTKSLAATNRSIQVSFAGLASSMRANNSLIVNTMKEANRAVQAEVKSMAQAVKANSDSISSSLKSIREQNNSLISSLQSNTVALNVLKSSYASVGKSINNTLTQGFQNSAAQTQLQTQIMVNALKNLQIQANSTKKSLQNIDGNTSGMSAFASKAKSVFTTFSKISFYAFLIEQGINQIVSAMSPMVEYGLKFATQMETLRLGYAGIIASTTQENGQDVPYARALQISESLLEKVRNEALKTSLTVSELGEAFQSAMATGLNAGMDMNQILDMTVVAAQAVKSFGLPKQQVIQEIRGLISGEAIRLGVDMLATVLGYTTATVNKLREEGKLYEDLMQRMKGFKSSSDDFQDSMQGLVSNLQDGIDQVQAKAIAPLFEYLKDGLRSVQSLFFTIKDEIINANGTQIKTQKVELNESTVESFREFYSVLILVIESVKNIGLVIYNVLSPAFEALYPFVKDALKVITIFSTGLRYSSEVIKLVGDTIVSFLDNVRSLGAELFGIGDSSDVALEGIDSISEGVREANPLIYVMINALAVMKTLFEELKNPISDLNTFFKIKFEQMSAYVKALGKDINAWFKSLNEVKISDLLTGEASINPDYSEGDALRKYGDSLEKSLDSLKFRVENKWVQNVKEIDRLLNSDEGFNKVVNEINSNLKGKFKASKEDKSSGKGASKVAKSAYKALEAELKKSIESLKAQLEQLEYVFKNNQMSVQDYVEKYLENKRSQIDEQIRILQEKIKVAQGLGQDSDVERFSEDIEKLQIQRTELLAESTRKLANAYRDLQKTYDSISKSYHSIYGATKESTTDDIVNDIGSQYARAIIEVKEAQERLAEATKSNNQEEARIWESWLEKGKKAEQQVLAIARARLQEYEIQQAQAEIEAINIDSLERMNEIEMLEYQARMDSLTAEGRKFQERQKHMDEYIDSYAKVIALYETEAELATTLSQQNYYKQKAEEAKQALREIAEEVPPFQKKMKETFSDGLADMFDSIATGESSPKEAIRNLGKTLINTWMSEWHKRLATDISNNLFDFLLPKSEKPLKIEGELDVKVEEYKEKIKVQMEEGVNLIKEGSVKLSTEFDNLIPKLQSLGDAIVKASNGGGGTGSTPASGSGSLGSTIGRPTENTNTGYITTGNWGITSGGYNLSNDYKDYDINDTIKDLGNGIAESSDLYVDQSKLLANSNSALKDNTAKIQQTALQALPAMLTSLAAVSGNEGLMKFAMALQVVMAVIQMIQAINSVGGIGLATGGYVKGAGTSTSDSIPARLSDGEYVIRAAAVKKLGVGFLDSLNGGKVTKSMATLPRFRFADGGYVQGNNKTTTSTDTQSVDSGGSVVVNFNPVFQSLDPAGNMKLFEQQYAIFENKIIQAMKRSQPMRNAVKGAVT